MTEYVKCSNLKPFQSWCVCVSIAVCEYIQVKLQSMTAELKGNDYIFDGFVCERKHNFQLKPILLFRPPPAALKADIDFGL